MRSRKLDSVTIVYIGDLLRDTFLMEYFTNENFREILETITTNPGLEAKDLSVSYLQIVPHDKSKNVFFGLGIGILSFSKIYFNKDSSKAVIYYEFICGPKCGVGEIIFLNKTWSKWKIEKYKRVFDF